MPSNHRLHSRGRSPGSAYTQAKPTFYSALAPADFFSRDPSVPPRRTSSASYTKSPSPTASARSSGANGSAYTQPRTGSLCHPLRLSALEGCSQGSVYRPSASQSALDPQSRYAGSSSSSRTGHVSRSSGSGTELPSSAQWNAEASHRSWSAESSISPADSVSQVSSSSGRRGNAGGCWQKGSSESKQRRRRRDSVLEGEEWEEKEGYPAEAEWRAANPGYGMQQRPYFDRGSGWWVLDVVPEA